MRQSASGNRESSDRIAFAMASRQGTYRLSYPPISLRDLLWPGRTKCRRTGRAIKHLASQRTVRLALFEPRPKARARRPLSLDKLAFTRNAFMRFVGALDAIFRLVSAQKLFDHLENPARHLSAPAISDLSWLNPAPHAIAVYASQPLLPAATQRSLPSGRYSLLGPDFHRQDRTSFAWRTYSITSSARASSMGGMSSPSALAVFRLMTNSNRVGRRTGRSAGLSPLRTRLT